jgi:hypothetical protein
MRLTAFAGLAERQQHPSARRRADRGAGIAERPRWTFRRRRRHAGGKLGFARRALHGVLLARFGSKAVGAQAVYQLPDVLGLARQVLDPFRAAALGGFEFRVDLGAPRDDAVV